jgi:hypothetical protein
MDFANSRVSSVGDIAHVAIGAVKRANEKSKMRGSSREGNIVIAIRLQNKKTGEKVNRLETSMARVLGFLRGLVTKRAC